MTRAPEVVCSLVEEVREPGIRCMAPLEAITRLYELQQKAKENLQ